MPCRSTSGAEAPHVLLGMGGLKPAPTRFSSVHPESWGPREYRHVHISGLSWIPCQNTSGAALILAQRLHGLDRRRAVRGNQGCDRADDQQQDRDTDIRPEIDGLHMKEE